MRRASTIGAAFAAALVAGVGAAEANQTVHYHGLILQSGTGTALAEIDAGSPGNNLFQKLTQDAQGDRMHVQAPWRDRAPHNGHSVYVRIDWSKNGTYCYLSGIGIGSDSANAGVSCGSGWNGYGQSKSTHIEDSGWWFFNANKGYDQRSDSIRAAVMTCEDHSFAADPCSPSRFGGISY